MSNTSDYYPRTQAPTKINVPYVTTYKNDRRKHRHRCRACGHVVCVGDSALMVRMNKSGKTVAIHSDCADKIASLPDDRDHPMTWRQVMVAWGAGT